MSKGLAYGDVALIDGERVEFNERECIIEPSGFCNEILRGGRYSASTIMLDISCNAGRYGLVSELQGVRKVGRFKGETLAKYLQQYLDGNYEEFG